MWGIRVTVPKKLQEDVLKELHRDHQGIAKMKADAGSYIWWPGLDKSLEQIARDCEACKLTKSMPAVAPFTHGCGPSAHDNIYTSISLICSKVKYFLCLLMPIGNGQK